MLLVPHFNWCSHFSVVAFFAYCFSNLCLFVHCISKRWEIQEVWNCARRLIQSIRFDLRTLEVFRLVGCSVVKRPLGTIAPTALDQFCRLMLSSDANLKWRLRYDLTPFLWWFSSSTIFKQTVEHNANLVFSSVVLCFVSFYLSLSLSLNLVHSVSVEKWKEITCTLISNLIENLNFARICM